MNNGPGLENKIRFDGVYRSSIGNNVRKFFRFYQDGTVIEVTTEAEVNDITPWFRKDKFTEDYHSVGIYQMKGNEIAFSTTALAYGTMMYKGTFKSGSEILIKSKSLINGNELKYTAVFIELDI